MVDFVNAFRDQPFRVADKVFLSCGVYESLIYENRSLVPILQSTGMDVRYVEVVPTGTTGRTGATACARVSPSCSPGRSGWFTVGSDRSRTVQEAVSHG
ncbi:MAG: hypothetical protein R2862_12110 [Thermoanaerobaculia bacterium]